MQEKSKVMKYRYKGLFALLLGLVLIVCWIQMPEVAYATEYAFPENEYDGNSLYNSGSEIEPEEEIDTSISKQAGHISVSVDDYIYGTTVQPQVTSNTGDVSKAVLTFKVTGASDSTYTSQMPTEVGSYTVQAVLPEDTYYATAVATDTFTISYLTSPSPAYELIGTPGENGWYTSDITIVPPQGYEMSVGNRDSFSTEGYVVSEETNMLHIYLRKTSTGGMTDVISIANLRIDTQAPLVSNLDSQNEYYVDSLEVNFFEDNFDSVTVNEESVEVEDYSDGQYGFAIESGMKRMTFTIKVKDDAGNETMVSVIIGPAWLEEGIVGEGEYYLEKGVEYSFPANAQWQKDGDNTVYSGGVSFYSNEEGVVTFTQK